MILWAKKGHFGTCHIFPKCTFSFSFLWRSPLCVDRLQFVQAKIKAICSESEQLKERLTSEEKRVTDLQAKLDAIEGKCLHFATTHLLSVVVADLC